MLRITRETDYGILLLTAMARDPDAAYSAATLAEQWRLPKPMVSKILKGLTRAGLVSSRRGAQGGYSLARQPQQITAADVIHALEGPIAFTECSIGHSPSCVHEHHCTAGNHWWRISQAIEEALSGISLQEMSRPVFDDRLLVRNVALQGDY